jgi:D-glycero-D-manno-heptose 1,7-bisphosphate phosphatase
MVTNQAGIARGYYQEWDVKKLHQWINDTLTQIGARIDGFYYCPHHPTEGIKGYKRRCDCRKPSPGLYRQAIHDFNIDCSKSYVVGDKLSDLIPGKQLGCTTILTLTGYGRSFADCSQTYIDYIAANLYEAAKYYIP